MNDAQYDYELLILIHAFFSYMYTCIVFVCGRASLSSIGVVYAVSKMLAVSPCLSCLGVLFTGIKFFNKPSCRAYSLV